MAPNQTDYSLLPESILIIIVSLLPLKDAIRTSVLAKPWRFLWYFRPEIEINERHFFTKQEYEQIDHNKIKQFERQKFTSCFDFGCRWIYNPSYLHQLSSFKLVFSYPKEVNFYIQQFIHVALLRRINSLELDFSLSHWHNRLPIGDSYTERYDLPQFVYHYKFLESIKLVSCDINVDILAHSQIGRTLKSVSLAWIEFPNHSSMLPNLVQSCSSLESLSLIKCRGATIFDINSNTLKSLVIDECPDVLEFNLTTPNLTSFKYRGLLIEFAFYFFKNLEFVEFDFQHMMSAFDNESGEKIIDLLSKFYDTRSLSVCGFVTQVLPAAEIGDEYLSQYGRQLVKELIIHTAFDNSEFYGILCLLNNYPFVEKLRFVFGQQTILEDCMLLLDNPPDTFWNQIAPLKKSCVGKKLRVLEIEGFQENIIQYSVLIFFLKYGHVLETIVVRLKGNKSAEEFAMSFKHFVMRVRNNVNVEVIP